MQLYDVCTARACNVCLMQQTESITTEQKTAVVDLLYEKERRFLCACKLVVYCSKYHQKLDRPLHKDLCKAAMRIMHVFKVTHPLHHSGLIRSKKEMREAIMIMKALVRCLLDRYLHYYEEELTSFPAYCEVCFKVTMWEPCTDCRAVTYCSTEHALQDAPEHKLVCETLKLIYHPNKVVKATDMEVRHLISAVKPPGAVDLVKWFDLNSSKKLPQNPTASLEDYQIFAFAADFSCVGTICQALSYVELKSIENSELIIFIVGATVEQQLWFREVHTKFIFSCYPALLALALYFIGPKAEYDSLTRSLMYSFNGTARKVTYDTYQGKFEDFIKNYKIKPTLIVGFNCGIANCSPIVTDVKKMITKLDKKVQEATPKEEDVLKEEISLQRPPKPDVWVEGVKAMLRTLNVPIVLTSFTMLEAVSDYGYILEAAEADESGVEVNRLLPAIPNNFRDLRPLRSFLFNDAEHIFYRNGYVQAFLTKAK